MLSICADSLLDDDSKRVRPAAKLVASVLLRPGISLGAMVSPGAGAAAGVVSAAAFDAEGDVALAAGETVVDFAESAEVPAGAGPDATSPALADERGVSATQAVKASAESAARTEGRTRDMKALPRRAAAPTRE